MSGRSQGVTFGRPAVDWRCWARWTTGDSQAMLVDELGVGLELRRRFGKHEDKMWFVRLGREYQNWSDVDAPSDIDQRAEGTSLTVWFAW